MKALEVNMDREQIYSSLAQKNDRRIVLLVMDGVGGIPNKEGKTALEAAHTHNLDLLAQRSSCGLTVPVLPGITPGSGPAHFSLFGYDPIKYNVGRGILEALGLDVSVGPQDMTARGNFCSLQGDVVTDRRAGRISTETNGQLISLLKEKIREIDGVGVELTSGKEHRFVLKLTHPKLSDRLGDADPQMEGEKVRYAEPLEQDERTLFTARIVKSFMERVREVLKDSHPANGVLLRGFTLPPRIPSMADLFQLRPAAIANYPMYRGLAKLVGMTVLPTGPEVEDEMATLRREWDRYDYFFIHVKKTDSYGEDGNFENKKSVIEKVDCLIPEILSLKPDVFAITGDHSTPCRMKGHSWHPNPFLLFSPYVFAGACQRFTERECAKGILGIFPSVDILPFLMANALKLKKYGA